MNEHKPIRISRQLKRFIERINKELEAYRKEENLSNSQVMKEERRLIITGIKDTVYLLGASFGEQYEYANGFRRFCEETGINFNDSQQSN